MRSVPALLLLATLLSPAARAQDDGRPSAGATHVPASIRVRLAQDGRPLQERIRVQLRLPTGVTVAEAFTNERGEADLRGTAPGSYVVTVSSPALIEAVEQRFDLMPRETTRYLFVNVRFRPPEGTDTQAAGAPMVGVWALKVPKQAREQYDRGDAASRFQDWDAARKHFAAAVDLYPDYASAYNNLGTALMNLGQRAEGQKAFAKAVEIDPLMLSAQMNLARTFVSNGGYAQAEPALLAVASAEPHNAEALTLLAFCQLNLDKPAAALENARKVHELPHDRFAMAHFLAARLLEAQQHASEAIAEYELFLREAPTHAKANVARRALESLRPK